MTDQRHTSDNVRSTQPPTSSEVSALEPNDLSLMQPGPSANSTGEQHPQGMNLRLTIPKRAYSMARQDSLLRMETPIFDRKKMRKNQGPSSPGTVLTVAGLFVVGLTLILSGVIVLCQQIEKPFIITGSLFVAIGSVMILISAILQRKNIIKFVLDLNRDLYFLNMSDSYMWKLMFVERTHLPEPQQDGFANT